MHTELTFSMLSVRVAEIRSRWLDNQSQFTSALCAVEDNFNVWLEVHAGIQNCNEFLTKLHLGMSALKEAETNPSHRLYMLQVGVKSLSVDWILHIAPGVHAPAKKVCCKKVLPSVVLRGAITVAESKTT